MKFKVTIRRTVGATATIEVEANKGSAAAAIALAQGVDLLFAEDEADYDIESNEYLSGADTNGFIWANGDNQKVLGRGQDAAGVYLVLNHAAYGTNICHRNYSEFHGSNLAKFDLYVQDESVPVWGGRAPTEPEPQG